LPFPASHFTRLAVARSTGVPYVSAARRISCIEWPVALSASTTFATESFGSCNASSTGLRPYTVIHLSRGDFFASTRLP
jgi:hypothetical protein